MAKYIKGKRRKNTDKLSIYAQGFVLSVFLSEFIAQLNSKPGKSISTFYQEFEKKLGVPHKDGMNVIFTPGALLGLLYVLIVFPKEKFKLPNPKDKIDKLDKIQWGDIKIEISKREDINLETLLRRMRNAIAHARIKFNDKMDFIFEDSHNSNTQPEIRIIISLCDMEKFTSCIAQKLALPQKEAAAGGLGKKGNGVALSKLV